MVKVGEGCYEISRLFSYILLQTTLPPKSKYMTVEIQSFISTSILPLWPFFDLAGQNFRSRVKRVLDLVTPGKQSCQVHSINAEAET